MSSSGKTVKAIYQTGPDDELLVKDGYEGSKPYAGTKTGTSFDELRDSAVDTLEQLKEQAEDLESETADVNDEIATEEETPDEPYSEQESSQRMAAGNSTLSGLLNNLSQEARSSFGMSSSLSNVTLNGASLGSGINVTDLKAIIGIINNLANGNFANDVKDTGAVTVLITRAVTAASNSGVQGAYTALVKNPTIDRSVLVDSATSSIRSTVAAGNISLAMDVASSGLMPDVIKKDPGIIKAILEMPNIKNITPKDRVSLFGILNLAFNINDNAWNAVETDRGILTDLKNINISDAVSNLIKDEVHSLPLIVLPGSENTLNPAIDKYLSNPSGTGIMEAIYGPNVTSTEITEIKALWDSEENTIKVNNHKRNVDMLIGSTFDNISVQTSLDINFDYLNITVNSSISR